MRHRLFMLPIVISLCIALAGCSDLESSHNAQEYMITNRVPIMVSAGRNVYDNGLVYHQGSIAMFLDFATMQSMPICNKPNCTHSDSTCVAKSCVANTNTIEPIIYHDKIYYFTSTNKIVDADDGKSQSFSIHSTCFCSNIKTGETETFLQFDNYDPTGSVNSVLIDSKWYFIASDDNAYRRNDGSWSYGMGGKQYLCCIDLETADFQNYGLVNDSPFAEYNNIREGNYTGTFNAQVMIEGVYDNKIYMYYQYVTDQNELINVLESSENPLQAVWTDVPWIYESKVYDIETHSLTTSNDPTRAIINSDYFVYFDTELECYRELKDNSESNLAGFRESWSPKIVNGKLWNLRKNENETPQVYDFATDEITNIQSMYTTYDSNIYACYDDKYIVTYIDENKQQKYVAVPEYELIGDTK